MVKEKQSLSQKMSMSSPSRKEPLYKTICDYKILGVICLYYLPKKRLDQKIIICNTTLVPPIFDYTITVFCHFFNKELFQYQRIFDVIPENF